VAFTQLSKRASSAAHRCRRRVEPWVTRGLAAVKKLAAKGVSDFAPDD
jgi:hypothetical protein